MSKNMNGQSEQHDIPTEYVIEAIAQEKVFAHPDFQSELTHTHDGHKYIVDCHHVKHLNVMTRKWIFELCKNNVQKHYEDSRIGWDDGKKKTEMTNPNSRYILVRDQPTKNLVAFSHFRFDMDYGEEVIYCYELHVANGFQRQGIGKFILGLLEDLGFAYRMDKVIMTVFKSNELGHSFYTKCGYSKDVTSPDGTKRKPAEYIVLSKYISEMVVESEDSD